MLNNQDYVIFETTITNDWTIKLEQLGDVFRVHYGESSKYCYSYESAAKELGECIMHSLNCEGKIEQC